MPACPLQSFLETPIHCLTAQVRFKVPVLADARAHLILRDVWLQTARRDRWFVGPYQVRPDRVSLMACPGRSAASVDAWTATWKATVAVRVKLLTGGHGPFWESGAPPELVATAADYEARCAALLAEPAGSDHAGIIMTGAQGGVLWQLLPAERPDSDLRRAR